MTPQELRCVALFAAAVSAPQHDGMSTITSSILERAAEFEEWLRQPAKPFDWEKPPPPADTGGIVKKGL